MKNVNKRNLCTCIHLSQREFERIIESLYPGATAESDIDCPWLIKVYHVSNPDYFSVLKDLEEYFDICISSYHAEACSDGGYDVWIDYYGEKENPEEQTKSNRLITRTEKCYNELNNIWDNYFTQYPDEEDYCTHMDNLFYDFEDMINRMKERIAKINQYEEEEEEDNGI